MVSCERVIDRTADEEAYLEKMRTKSCPEIGSTYTMAVPVPAKFKVGKITESDLLEIAKGFESIIERLDKLDAFEEDGEYAIDDLRERISILESKVEEHKRCFTNLIDHLRRALK